ncbi:MAG: UDP-2,4-diacetamido-2,4,6-trideoxy-beta-L-altropyranose hydrolase [Bacteroidia bacterium]
MSKPSIIFRADGNNNTGLGHVYRCLALAEMLGNEFSCSFAIFSPEEETITQINTICDEIVLLQDFDIHAFVNGLMGNEIVVLDGYHFNTDDQIVIKSKGCFLVCIDDLHNQHFVADVVINHSLTVSRSDYSVERNTVIYFGVDYILLRKEFLDAAKGYIEKVTFRNPFVCFGGADSNNFSFKFSSYLKELENIDNIHVLIGSAFNGSIEQIKSLELNKVHVYQNIEAAEIIAIMRKSDFAIVSASSIAYECASVGLPILVGYYLESQIEFYNALLSQKNVWGLGEIQTLKFDELSALIFKLPLLYQYYKGFIDGNQRERYLKLFHELLSL